ncbi:MAG TPA: hypothetical protein PL056_07325, partial [bacterium]|nr:hypothetical protein [bacterium]
GDSNADGNSVPASMDWGGVWLNSAMVGISIKNTEISYGGESDEGADSGLRVDGGTSLLIENVEFRNNEDDISIFG